MGVRIDKQGTVWTVIHSRPEARNAMDPASARELYESFLEFDADDTASVAVFWGEGGAFCAGWDLKHAAALEGDDSLATLDFSADDANVPQGPMGPSRLDLSKPVIAAVAGPAVAGGMELAMWCDFRVMERSAYMGVYCRRWGIPLIDGGTVRLPRLVGQGRALELILTGRQIMADECHRIGLAEYVVDDGGSRDKAEALARQISEFPQICARADRRSALDQWGLPLQEALSNEFTAGRTIVAGEGIAGAGRFAAGAGRHGSFGDGE